MKLLSLPADPRPPYCRRDMLPWELRLRMQRKYPSLQLAATRGNVSLQRSSGAWF
ncbi:hypothetical protein ACVMDO_006556 [Bradyrhizobium sp. USDA 4513]